MSQQLLYESVQEIVCLVYNYYLLLRVTYSGAISNGVLGVEEEVLVLVPPYIIPALSQNNLRMIHHVATITIAL